MSWLALASLSFFLSLTLFLDSLSLHLCRARLLRNYYNVHSFSELLGFDPNDPKGEKAAAMAKADAEKTAAAKKKKAAGADLDDLLSAGLGKPKKK